MISPFCQLLTLRTDQPFTLPWFSLLLGLFLCGFWFCCFCFSPGLSHCAAYTVWFRDSWLGGALVSAQCCVVSITHGVRGWRFLWLFLVFVSASSAIPIPRMIQGYHPSVSYWRCNWPAVHFALFFFGFCLGCFGVVLVLFVCCSCFFLVVFSTGLVTANWTVYWSCVSSSFVAHLLWRWITSLL